MISPCDNPPFPVLCISLLGVATQKYSGKRRLNNILVLPIRLTHSDANVNPSPDFSMQYAPSSTWQDMELGFLKQTLTVLSKSCHSPRLLATFQGLLKRSVLVFPNTLLLAAGAVVLTLFQKHRILTTTSASLSFYMFSVELSCANSHHAQAHINVSSTTVHPHDSPFVWVSPQHRRLPHLSFRKSLSPRIKYSSHTSPGHEGKSDFTPRSGPVYVFKLTEGSVFQASWPCAPVSW